MQVVNPNTIHKIINKYGVDLQIYTGSTGGHREHGEWVADDGTPLSVHEPLVPYDSTSQPQQGLSYQAGGTSAIYDTEWVSEQKDIPLKTVVEHVPSGRKYIVVHADMYTDYTNVTIYELKVYENDA